MPITSINNAELISGHKGRDRWMCALAAASDLSTMAYRLALRLCVSFNCKTGRCDPGFPKLAEDMAVSKRTVSRAIDELETAGWVSVDRTGGDNTRNAQINLLIPGTGEPRSGDNMLSPEKEPTGATSGDNILSPDGPSLQVTENAPSGDKNRGGQVTDSVAAQITCEPVNLKSPAVPAGRTFPADRESVASNSENTSDDEPLIQRAPEGALGETVEAQHQPLPERVNPIGAAPNDADGTDAGQSAFTSINAAFAWLLSEYPKDRIGDEAKAFFALCRAEPARGSVSAVLEDIASLKRERGADVPDLAEALMTIANERRTP
jgi:hypothetical protein